MRASLPCIVTVAFLLASVGSSRFARAESERRLVVIESHSATMSRNAREHLHSAIAEVVQGHGIQVVARKMLSEKLQKCDLPGCLPQIAAATGAVFVLAVDAKFVKESFHLAIGLWNSESGKLLGRDVRDCPICDEQDLWGSAALLTKGVLDRALAAPVKPLPPSPPSPPPVAAVASAPVTPVASTPAVSPVHEPVETSQASGAVAYTGLALAVVGLSAVVVGAYYWHVDGSCSDDTCDYYRDTRKLGLPMTLAGGALFAVGGGLLAWQLWPRGASVSLAPSGVRLAGRF
jgi:hypothetical protein